MHTTLLALSLLLLCAACGSPAPDAAYASVAPKAARPAALTTSVPTQSAPAPSHDLFTKLLRRYVSPQGQVDYAGLTKDRVLVDTYLEQLSQNPPAADWSRDERLAYWINAYNAGTLQLIVDNYPVASITDLDNGKPWDVKRVELGGTTYSLNEIENDIIRPRFGEPRIHFAVNCAAKSCPPLRNEAYTAERLDAQLEEQTRKFLNNEAYTAVDGDQLRVSKIFEWYGEDFEDLPAFIARYRDVPAGAQITYAEYDWALNGE